MSFIHNLLYKKKQIKAHEDFSKTGPASESENLTEDPEDEEAEEEQDNAFHAQEGCPAEEDSGEEYEIVEREILPAKIICPDCGGITLEGLEFCDKCGGELQ